MTCLCTAYMCLYLCRCASGKYCSIYLKAAWSFVLTGVGVGDRKKFLRNIYLYFYFFTCVCILIPIPDFHSLHASLSASCAKLQYSPAIPCDCVGGDGMWKYREHEGLRKRSALGITSLLIFQSTTQVSNVMTQFGQGPELFVLSRHTLIPA